MLNIELLNMAPFINKNGFTMIELLSVIMIIAILGAAAVPQFLDFRNEARKASLIYTLNNVRVGLKNQKQRGILVCNNPPNQFPSQSELNANVSACATGVSDLLTDKSVRFIDAQPSFGQLCFSFSGFGGGGCLCLAADVYRPVITKNPFNPRAPNACSPFMAVASFVYQCQGAACTNRCVPCDGSATFSNEYCYNPLTGDFWADSNTVVGGSAVCLL